MDRLLNDEEIKQTLKRRMFEKDGSLVDGWHPRIVEYGTWTAQAQDAKTLKVVGEWLETQAAIDYLGRGIDQLKQGKMPEE